MLLKRNSIKIKYIVSGKNVFYIVYQNHFLKMFHNMETVQTIVSDTSFNIWVDHVKTVKWLRKHVKCLF